MAEEDAVHEAIADSLRTTLMAAGRIGEQLARLRENQLRHSEARSAQQSRELQNRLDSERLAARNQLDAVRQPTWWDHATAADIGEAWQLAEAWRGLDPEIARSQEVVEREVRDRWGIDVHNTGASPALVREHLQRVVELARLADDEQSQARKAEAQAAALLLEADGLADSRHQVAPGDVDADIAVENSIRETAAALQSDAELHFGQAAKFEGLAADEAAEAKFTADRGQEFPPAFATAAARPKRPRRPHQGVEHVQEQTVSR